MRLRDFEASWGARPSHRHDAGLVGAAPQSNSQGAQPWPGSQGLRPLFPGPPRSLNERTGSSANDPVALLALKDNARDLPRQGLAAEPNAKKPPHHRRSTTLFS